MSENIIELNGKRYDAVTGTYLGKSKATVVPAVTSPIKGKVIDGFVRQQPIVKPKPAPSFETLVKKEAVPDLSFEASAEKEPAKAAAVEPEPKKGPEIVAEPKPEKVEAQSSPKHVHAKAKHAAAHHPESSKALKRSTVAKPVAKRKATIKPQAPVEVVAKPASSLMRKRSVGAVDPAKAERAVLTPKHPAVKRFHPHAASHTSDKVPQIPVRQAPPKVAPIAKKTHSDIFESAMHEATSHEQPKHHVKARGRRRLANTLAFVVAFLVIGGFIGYLNLPNLQLHVASLQAGFKASIPGYEPTGYAMAGGVERSGTVVRLTYRSGSSNYTITQQASDWNSQTLLDNTLALSDNHTTVQRGGQTIYIYGKHNNAAWVNGGVRYDLSSNAELSPDDVATIASSL